MSIKSDLRYMHKIYKNDPTLFKSYINKQVEVTTKDSSVHHGILYTVDPVSESVVLMKLEENGKYNGKIVIGHSIEKIQLSTLPGMELPEFFQSTQVKLSDIQLIERKEAVKKLMTEKRFPINDNNGILEIQNVLSIEPPYEIDNCICSNPIIMSKIQSVLAQINNNS